MKRHIQSNAKHQKIHKRSTDRKNLWHQATENQTGSILGQHSQVSEKISTIIPNGNPTTFMTAYISFWLTYPLLNFYMPMT